VKFENGWSPKVEIGYKKKVYTFGEGDEKEFDV
jgi:hypothetical protein